MGFFDVGTAWDVWAPCHVEPHSPRSFRPSRKPSVDYVNRLITVTCPWRHAAMTAARTVYYGAITYALPSQPSPRSVQSTSQSSGSPAATPTLIRLGLADYRILHP